MILEAFSQILHRDWHVEGESAKSILHRWLLGMLTDIQPDDNVSKVIHTELEMHHNADCIAFLPKSYTGQILLNSLYLYCDSYESWQFSRWVHEQKPQHFNQFSR